MKLELVKPRTSPPISLKELEKVLPKICDKETSFDPDNWKPDNPFYGHCAVIALLVQNLLGGKLQYTSLKDSPKFAHMKTHYWNKLDDGTEVDFTKVQFGDDFSDDLKGKSKTPKSLLSINSVLNRFKPLAFRLAKALSKNNIIFNDPIYKACFYNAIESPCQKMKFGCVIIHNNQIVYEGHNDTMEPLESLCKPECIRFQIQSRTDQMLGACGHAEELGLWAVAKKRIPLDECELYIAGIHPNGLPWIKKEPEHTCLRCSTQMYNANVEKIFVPVIDKWIGITPKEALDTALKYATKEKTV